MRYSILVLLFASALVTAQDCSEDGPTLAAEGEDCSTTVFCNPVPKKATVSTDFGIDLDTIAFLTCVKSKCVWDYSIEHGEACERDASCKSGQCTGSKCYTPKAEDAKPDADGDDCSKTFVCFGENLICQAGTCKTITILNADEEGCVDALKACSEGNYCDILTPLLKGTCRAQKDDDEDCTTGPLGVGIRSFECKGGICAKNGKCTAGGSVGDSCDGLLAVATEPCAWNLWCDTTNADDKKCSDATKAVEDAADNLCIKKDSACTFLTAAVPVCSCDDELLVCNKGKHVQRWSLEADAPADNRQACHGELWYDSAAKKCVSELACKKDTDCAGASPYAGAGFVYCDCTDEVCKVIDDFSFDCRATEVTDAQKDQCTAGDNLSLSALLAAVDDVDFDKFKEQVEKVYNAALRYADAQTRCYAGSVGVSGGASMVVPTIFMMLISIAVSLTLM